MIRPLPGRRPALYMYIKPPLTVLDPTFLSLILYVLLWCCFVKVPYGLLDMDAGMDRRPVRRYTGPVPGTGSLDGEDALLFQSRTRWMWSYYYSIFT